MKLAVRHVASTLSVAPADIIVHLAPSLSTYRGFVSVLFMEHSTYRNFNVELNTKLFNIYVEYFKQATDAFFVCLSSDVIK